MKAERRKLNAQKTPRDNLRRLLEQIRKEPAKYLPERSVHALSAFFEGYRIHGHPIWPEVDSFEKWLRKKLFYPRDTGARWPRFIELNSYDQFDCYERFLALHSQFVRENDPEPAPTPGESLNFKTFDFFQYLYAINLRPGMYLGIQTSVKSLAAMLSGYFKGKLDAGLNLTRDEKRFFSFERWLQKSKGLPKKHPWHCIVEMWNHAAPGSLNCFFAYFDAYLTNYGRKPKGLNDLFIVVRDGESSSLRRRKQAEMPLKVIKAPESRRWWR